MGTRLTYTAPGGPTAAPGWKTAAGRTAAASGWTAALAGALVFWILAAALPAAASSAAAAAPAAAAVSAEAAAGSVPDLKLSRQAVSADRHWTTVDHTKIDLLDQAFTSGDQITQACLYCHTDASDQFKETIHWTWEVPSDKPGIMNGKAGHAVNNFCISGNAMEDTSCLSCHAGWNGKEGEVNCLACHGADKFAYKETFADLAAFEGDDDPDILEIVEDLQAGISRPVDQFP